LTLEQLGIKVKTLYAHDYYESGKMTGVITQALEHRDTIAEILTRVTGRELPADWQPYEPLDETTGKIRGNKITAVDTSKTRVKYVASDGRELWADYAKGQGKLPWRIDWPARWALLNIAFEPFGKEHAAAGGSYEAGREIVKKVYGKEAPLYEIYEHIYLAGEKKKMSASLGNLVSMADFLQVVPPAAARYFVLRSKNERHLIFDPAQGLMQLTDEFNRLEMKVFDHQADSVEKSLFAYAQISDKRVAVEVPFSHLVNTIQAAQGDFEEIKRQLKRTGHTVALKDEKNLKTQIKRVEKWLEFYAPEAMKFTVAQAPPKVEMRVLEMRVLEKVKEAIEQGQELHNAIYEAGQTVGLKPRETFQVIYKIFIDKESGPKAGFFLTMLDRNFVLKRLGHYL
jgi:lysyl-tRNA synthetase class 1